MHRSWMYLILKFPRYSTTFPLCNNTTWDGGGAIRPLIVPQNRQTIPDYVQWYSWSLIKQPTELFVSSAPPLLARHRDLLHRSYPRLCATYSWNQKTGSNAPGTDTCRQRLRWRRQRLERMLKSIWMTLLIQKLLLWLQIHLGLILEFYWSSTALSLIVATIFSHSAPDQFLLYLTIELILPPLWVL